MNEKAITERVARSVLAGFERVVETVLKDAGYKPGKDFWFEGGLLYLGEDMDFGDAGEMVEALNGSSQLRKRFRYDHRNHLIEW